MLLENTFPFESLLVGSGVKHLCLYSYGAFALHKQIRQYLIGSIPPRKMLFISSYKEVFSLFNALFSIQLLVLFFVINLKRDSQRLSSLTHAFLKSI